MPRIKDLGYLLLVINKAFLRFFEAVLINKEAICISTSLKNKNPSRSSQVFWELGARFILSNKQDNDVGPAIVFLRTQMT